MENNHYVPSGLDINWLLIHSIEKHLNIFSEELLWVFY